MVASSSDKLSSSPDFSLLPDSSVGQVVRLVAYSSEFAIFEMSNDMVIYI